MKTNEIVILAFHIHNCLCLDGLDEGIVIIFNFTSLVSTVRRHVLQHKRTSIGHQSWLYLIYSLLTYSRISLLLWWLEPANGCAVWPDAAFCGFVDSNDWFLDERFRSLLSFVIPPRRSPCDVYDILDWCEVYDECREPAEQTKFQISKQQPMMLADWPT